MSSKSTAAREEERLDAVFHALADSTRRKMVARLGQGPISIGELAAPFPISLAAISKHVDVLERAGVVERERDGRFRRCRLTRGALDGAAAFVETYRSFWTGTLDALAEYLEGPAAKKTKRAGK